jgi:hypothetical protein
MQAQYSFLHQVLCLLWRGATPAQELLQPAQLPYEHIHMGRDDATSAPVIPSPVAPAP